MKSKRHIAMQTAMAVLALLSMPGLSYAYAHLAGHWKFDETSGTTAYDACSNNNATIMNGTTINQAGRENKAYKFDGVNDYVKISNPIGLTCSTGAFEFWMKPDYATNGTLFIYYNSNCSDYIRSYLFADGRLDLVIQDDSVVKLNVYYDLGDLEGGYVGQWLHVVWTQDGTGTKLFINGEEKTLVVYSNNSWWSDHITVAGVQIGTGWAYFNGLLDNFKSYTQPLSEEEILSNYKHAFLAGHWKFDETNGVTAYDACGFNNATIYGATINQTGSVNKAYKFDGVNDYVGISNPTGLTSSTGAFDFWMKANCATNGTLFIFYENPGAANYIRSHLHADGRLDLVVEDDDVAQLNVYYNNLNSLEGGYVGQWLHIAWTQDGTGAKLYINGKEKPIFGYYNSAWWSGHLSLSGVQFGTAWNYFNGLLDEFQSYTLPLSKEEIVNRYIGDYTTANWHFDETSGVTVVDSSHLGNNGTVTNMSGDFRIDGVLGKALLFDGVNDQLTVNNPVGLTSSVGAIEFWMQADEARAQTLFVFYETSCTDYIRSHLSLSGNLDLVIEDNDVAKVNVYYNLNNLEGGYTNKPLHVLWSQDGGGVKLYINGKQKSLVTSVNSNYWSAHLNLAACEIGYGWGYFKGALDEFKVYRRVVSSQEVAQLYIDHGGYLDYGCDGNPTGNPIGGSNGYSDVISPTGADYYVTTVAELTNALLTAAAGDVIYVDDEAILDLSGYSQLFGESFSPETTIPGGVTLASGRGVDGSPGALLFNTNDLVFPMLAVGGANVRVTGLRLQGPNATINTSQYCVSSGIMCSNPYLEVDNCELSAWGHAAIYLTPGGTNAYLHHNYIHHCQEQGAGYGVSHGYGSASSLIEANLFDYNRHSIQGTGTTGNSYEARYNLVLSNALSHVFDMHGGGDRQDGTEIAGDSIYIHHNTVMHVTPYAAVCIRGVPNNGAWVDHNWFYRGASACYQTNYYGNYSVSDNVYTPERCYRSAE